MTKSDSFYPLPPDVKSQDRSARDLTTLIKNKIIRCVVSGIET